MTSRTRIILEWAACAMGVLMLLAMPSLGAIWPVFDTVYGYCLLTLTVVLCAADLCAKRSIRRVNAPGPNPDGAPESNGRLPPPSPPGYDGGMNWHNCIKLGRRIVNSIAWSASLVFLGSYLLFVGLVLPFPLARMIWQDLGRAISKDQIFFAKSFAAFVIAAFAIRFSILRINRRDDPDYATLLADEDPSESDHP